MIRLMALSIALLASSAALAEPVKLSDESLAAETAAGWRTRQTNWNNTQQNATANSTAIAVCYQCSNAVVIASATSIASNSNGSGQGNSLGR